ncbi:MAG: hypothetical protein E6G94_00315 [Alphaproteobacteria bacterium]|nr:MAG: hypothetical protein E6G94_00315 [Alphaproteobacteria bacterium]
MTSKPIQSVVAGLVPSKSGNQAGSTGLATVVPFTSSWKPQLSFCATSPRLSDTEKLSWPAAAPVKASVAVPIASSVGIWGCVIWSAQPLLALVLVKVIPKPSLLGARATKALITMLRPVRAVRLGAVRKPVVAALARPPGAPKGSTGVVVPGSSQIKPRGLRPSAEATRAVSALPLSLRSGAFAPTTMLARSASLPSACSSVIMSAAVTEAGRTSPAQPPGVVSPSAA